MPVFYECQRCTACCRWPGQVRLTSLEVTHIASFLGLSEDGFIQQYTRINNQRNGLALIDQEDGSCVFLKDSRCAIQDVKPQQCRDFPNLWNFPGFEKMCHATPVSLDEEEYRRRILEATGRLPE